MSGTRPKQPGAGEYLALAYIPSSVERREGLGPSEVRRRPWRPSEQVRVISTGISSGEPTATVWLEHRSHPGRAFRLEVDADGQLVSFMVRPLCFRVEQWTEDGELVSVVDIDPDGVPDGSPRLSATTIRDVPVGQLHGAALAAARPLNFTGAGFPEERPVPRPNATPDVELARFAADYVAAVAKGASSPLRDVAERWGLKYHTASRRRQKAVSRGLLTTAGRGRAGGRLTDSAMALLASG